MRATRLLNKTLFEDPADAELASHRLLARGGFIRKIASGVYVYSPLMWRTLRKIARIVREEMDAAGAQELMLPIIQPIELWEESGRAAAWLKSGNLFHLRDRRDAHLCLGPTHEEVVTDHVRATVDSYKQLPVTVYQIQNKYRDEFRPRFGLMRGREFIMKDAYSFDADESGLDASYRAMSDAYHAIFRRCGLRYVVVEADPGAIGGSASQEFMVTAEAGEDALLTCPACGYGANVERAESRLPPGRPGGELRAMRDEHTPDVTTVEQLASFFDLPAERMVKTVLFEAVHEDREEVVAVLVRGDQDVNPVKVLNALGALDVVKAGDETVRRVTGAAPGFAGPVGLTGVRLLGDLSIEGMTNVLCGGNRTDRHLLDVNFGRDLEAPPLHDLRASAPGDDCARCGEGALEGLRGIEVGHVFKLGTKYSEAMGATFADRDGRRRPHVMGCYGIGVSRIAAAAVEQHHDEHGILWPTAIAPVEVVVVPMKMNDEAVVRAAEKLYVDLRAAGVEALLDDREGRPGPKLKDSELIGVPFRVLAGRALAEGRVEVERRGAGDRRLVALEDVVSELRAAVDAERGARGG